MIENNNSSFAYEFYENSYEPQHGYNAQELSNEIIDKSIDVNFGAGMDYILLAGWMFCGLIGLATIVFLNQTLAGIAIIAIPTMIGMILKPTFSVCVFMLTLPTSAGIAIPGMLSLGRGVGFAVAFSFLLNLTVSRPHLRMKNKAIWCALALVGLTGLNVLRASSMLAEFLRFFTAVQLVILFLIVYWVITCNGWNSLKWILRSYVIGTVMMFIFSFLTGAAARSIVAGEGRLMATFGSEVNPNFLAGVAIMALFAAIYLFITDRSLLWKMFYLFSFLFLPVIILKLGSRGAVVAMALTVVSPVFFAKDLIKKPSIIIILGLFIILLAGLAFFAFSKGQLTQEVSSRYTDIDYAKQSLSYRLYLNRKAISVSLSNPLGTTFSGWFSKTSLEHFPHSDLFFMLGAYGIIGAGIFSFFFLFLFLTVKKMPLGIDKIYARAILTYLFIVGFNNVYIWRKFFWVFLAISMAFYVLEKRKVYIPNQPTYSEPDLIYS